METTGQGEVSLAEAVAEATRNSTEYDLIFWSIDN